MAQSTLNPGNGFNELLETLTEEIDADDLHNLLGCFELDESRKIGTKSSLRLLLDLQKEGRFTEENVDEVLRALIQCNLIRAANLVKDYIDEAGIDSSIEYEKNENEDDWIVNCAEHKEKLELLCNTCNVRICYGCVYHSHRGKDHQVISGTEIQEKVDVVKKELQEKLLKLDDTVKETQEFFWGLGSSNRDRPTLNRRLEEQFEIWLLRLDEHENYVKSELYSHICKVGDDNKDMKIKLNDLTSALTAVKQKLLESAETFTDEGHQFKQLKRWNEVIDNTNERFESEILTSSTNKHAFTSFLPLSAEGRFVDFYSGTVVGSISVSMEAAVMVRDERCYGRGVTFSCVSSKNEGLFWTNEIEDMDSNFPLVISGSMFVPGANIHAKVLIACGSKLVAISVAREDIICSIVNTETKQVPIGEGSYITAVTTITSGSNDTGALVAESASTQLVRLNRTLDFFDKVDCSSLVHSISSVACVDSEIAVIDSVKDEVVIIKEDIVMNLSCKLSVPTVTTTPSRAKFVQWDGNFWGLIWESTHHDQDVGPKWQHAIYTRDGKLYNSGVSGACYPNTEIVSMSFIKDQSLICFSNGQIKTFSTITV